MPEKSEQAAQINMPCEAIEKLTTTPLLSKLFIIQSVKNSPPTGEVDTDCNHKHVIRQIK
jgi:hypothetical protein